MLWSRSHLIWLGFCLAVAVFGATVLMFLLVTQGPPRPADTPIDLAVFLMAIYTLPLSVLYLLGLGIGWAFRRIRRGRGRVRGVEQLA